LDYYYDLILFIEKCKSLLVWTTCFNEYYHTVPNILCQKVLEYDSHCYVLIFVKFVLFLKQSVMCYFFHITDEVVTTIDPQKVEILQRYAIIVLSVCSALTKL